MKNYSEKANYFYLCKQIPIIPDFYARMKKNKKVNPKTSEKKTKKTKNVSTFGLKILNIAGSLFFYILTAILLIVYKNDFLFRIEELSVFIFDSVFFKSFMDEPGGFLFYAGSFVMQFLYYPELGAAIIILLLVLIQWLTYKCFNINRNLFLLTLIPGTLLLISLTGMDYAIYALFDRQFIISQFIGFAITSLGFYGYKSIRSTKIKIGFIIVWTIITYPFFGFYALLSTLLMAFYELIKKDSNVKNRLLLSASGLIPILLIPLFYYYFLYDTVNSKLIYFYGLPVFDFSIENKLWIPSVILFLSPFILLLFYRFISIDSMPKIKHAILNSLLLIACISAVIVFTYKDNNFHVMLKMERALENRDYNEIIRIADKNKNEYPLVRPIIMYTNIALFNKGLLLDKSFTYSNESEDFNSSLNVTGTKIAAPAVFYHYGKLNFSYRWCMESTVQSGQSIYCLKYMAKIALLNGEKELAKKYLETLKKTLFHKQWAEKYESYLYDPKLAEEDEEFKIIKTLIQYPGTEPESSLAVELSVLEFYNDLNGGTPNMLIYALHSTLVMKISESFWHKLGVYVSLNPEKRLPMHIQEAAIMYGKIEEKNLEMLNLDESIVRRYDELIKLAQQYNREPDEEMKNVFRKRFGNTYWFYYFFVEDIMTN